MVRCFTALMSICLTALVANPLAAQVTHLKEYSGEKKYVVFYWEDVGKSQRFEVKAFASERSARDFFYTMNDDRIAFDGSKKNISPRAFRPIPVPVEDWKSPVDRAEFLEKWEPKLKEYAANEAKKIRFVDIPTVDVKVDLSPSRSDKRESDGQGRIVMNERNAPPKRGAAAKSRSEDKSKVKTAGLVNTTWGGLLQSFNDKDNSWRSMSDAFLITFKPDGRCIILTGTSEGTVTRSEGRWKAAEGGITVDNLPWGRNNMTFPIAGMSTDVNSNVREIAGSDFKERFWLRKGLGLMKFPPSAAYKAYSYRLNVPGETPDYQTADEP